MALGGTRGQAIVLDNPRDPLAIYQQNQNAKAMQSYRQQQLGLSRQKQQDTETGKILGFKYEDPGDRFRSWGQDTINRTNQAVMGVFQNNPNVDATQLRGQIMQLQGSAQKDLNKAKEVNNLYDEKVKSIGSLKNVDQEEATRIMNQAIAKNSPYDVDTNKLQNLEQIPAIYDLNSLVADSVSGIKGQFQGTNVGKLQSSPLGLFMTVEDNKLRFKDMDKTIDYILRGDDVTQEGINQKVNGGIISDRIRYGIAQQEVAKAGGDPNDVDQVMPKFKQIQYDKNYSPKVREELKGILDQLNQEERDVRVQRMGNFRQAGTKEQEYIDAKKRREESLDAITKPFGPANALKDPTGLAQQSLGKLRGGDFMGGKVTNAQFKKGGMTVSPEYMKVIRQAFEQDLYGGSSFANSTRVLKGAKDHMVPTSSNQIIFDTKTGTMFGEPVPITLPFDLNNQDTKVILNAMMNQNAGERKIYFDDLYKNTQSSPSGNIYDDQVIDFESDGQ